VAVGVVGQDLELALVRTTAPIGPERLVATGVEDRAELAAALVDPLVVVAGTDDDYVAE